MKSRIFAAIAFLMFSATGLADSVCLSQASNQQLLNEIARRLDSSTPGSQSVVVSLSCTSWQLQINLTSLDGASGSDSINFANGTACSNFVTQFGATKTLRSNKIIGACRSYQLSRLLLKTDATFQDLPAIDYRNAAECEAAASALIGS